MPHKFAARGGVILPPPPTHPAPPPPKVHTVDMVNYFKMQNVFIASVIEISSSNSLRETHYANYVESFILQHEIFSF